MSIAIFCVLIITVIQKTQTSVIQRHSIKNRLYGRLSLQSVWRNQIINTWCDSFSPNQQYINTANKCKTYRFAACARSLWSPQLCQKKNIIINDYSVTSWAYEYILQHNAASNCVEVSLSLITADESRNVIETSHITCYVLAVMKIMFVDNIV
jgi:hypothetical protein